MWSWILAYRNLGRNKRRSMATGLAIGAGFIGLVLISAYLYRVQRALQVSTVYINHKGHLALFKKNGLEEFNYKPSRYIISKEEQEKLFTILKSVERDIEFTGKYLTGTGLVNNQNKSAPFIATAVEPDVYQRVLRHKEVYTWISDWVFAEAVQNSGRFAENAAVISITQALGLLIGKQFPFDRYSSEERNVQLIGKSYFGDLNVVDSEIGLRHTTGMAMAEDTSLFLSLAQLQSLYATDGIQYLALFLNDPSRISKVQKILEKELAMQNLPIDILPFDDPEWGAYYVGSVGFLIVIACFFVLLICGAVILSVINTTTLGVFERYKEIGTLRATGFPPKSIYSLFWKENLILSLVALSAGYILSEWIAKIVNSADIKFHPPGTHGEIQFLLVTNINMTLSIALAVILINFLSTIAAVRRATQTSIVNLLSTSGG